MPTHNRIVERTTMSSLIHTPERFGFTEIVENNLPLSITGYAEASCVGHLLYTPPEGYIITECHHASVGTHGGCPSCIMCRVTCTPAHIPDDYLPGMTDTSQKSHLPAIALLIGGAILLYGIFKYRK